MAPIIAAGRPAGGIASGKAAAPDGERIYAIGDVHGCRRLLDAMLSRIERDAAGLRPARTRIVLVGDYTDRGPDSRGVLDRLETLAKQADTVMLRGNHDEAVTGFLDDPRMFASRFLRWGGVETLASYGVAADDEPTVLARRLREAMPASHRAFLDGLADHHVAGDYLFVHAGIRPGVRLAAQDPQDLLWIRGEFLHHRGLHPFVVVHGHTPSETPHLLANRIGVDTGACYTGRLTAIVLEGREQRVLQVTGEPC